MTGGKVRILSVINELMFGGDENRLLNFAGAIDRSRFELIVTTLKRPNPDLENHYGTMRGHYAAAGIEVLDLGQGHSLHGLSGGSPVRMQRAAGMFANSIRRVCEVARKRGVDVIDAHLGPGNLVGVAAGVALGMPRTVTTYNVEQWEPAWLWRPAHQWTMTMADSVITDSEPVAAALRKFVTRRHPSIHVIPNGVNPPRPSRTAAETRAALGLPADPSVRVVGQIATLFPSKGHNVLLESAATIVKNRPRTMFLIVGFVRAEANYRTQLEERARELGIADNVRIVSYPGDIGDVWQVIDVHAHPTLLDSLPNTIMEGMSLAKPAVVTSVGGIPSMVEHERTGLVVPPGDPAALSLAIERLLAEPQLAAALGAAAFERYQARYTAQVMTAALEGLFSAVASRRRTVA